METEEEGHLPAETYLEAGLQQQVMWGKPESPLDQDIAGNVEDQVRDYRRIVDLQEVSQVYVW